MMTTERIGTRERPVVAPHARRRIKEMGLTDHRVAAVLATPDISYRGSTRYPSGRRISIADGIGVVFTEDERGVTVVTVLWHGAEGRDDA